MEDGNDGTLDPGGTTLLRSLYSGTPLSGLVMLVGSVNRTRGCDSDNNHKNIRGSYL